ncbi:putative transcription factor C2H2 family [Lupinus albus]|uniref:Putative transcription factor C2H2 family n=1 Tax=Lupinus albus TaxID=3870 RepID=A0A6A4NB24_LUPAL|nr:putative transcription factor C2H2 family [Lupinus albus]
MKRQRDIEVLESIDLANCVMHLTHPQQQRDPMEFECKTCNRKFSSFQALGGHMTSHKRPKFEAKETIAQAKTLSLKLGNKPKFHKCCICGQEFSLGQALGGHMKRHRGAINEDISSIKKVVVVAKVAPLLKRSNSIRVMWLDLNFTPLENDFNLLFGNMTPKVHAFL